MIQINLTVQELKELCKTSADTFSATLLHDAVKELVQFNGGFVPAVKLYRKHTNTAFFEAKNACEAIREENKIF